MPELPEVEITKKGISSFVDSNVIQKIIVRDNHRRHAINAVNLILRTPDLNIFFFNSFT